MKSKFTLLVTFLILYFSASAVEVSINGNKTVASYTDSEITIQDKSELHLTSATPLINSTVNLSTEDSWLYFDNLKPSEVINNYLKNITVDGVAAKKNTNVRVEIYVQGAVVIPHPSTFQPLEAFTGQNFEGTSKKYAIGYAKNGNVNGLGEMSAKIRSFKLKKGYMATFATNSTGSGYSRVFIADTKDLELPTLPVELDETIAFIRVFKWDWVSKRGWCGTGSGGRTDGEKTKSTWFYTWSADNYSTDNIEYVPIRQNGGWPGWDQINALNDVTHVLGYNEPDHVEQSNLTVDQAIAGWPSIYQSGLRVGSPANTDFSWLYSFMDKCKELNYRIDYVVVHAYWGGKSPQNWYNDLKYIHERTGRPIWIKEWNNGANWTTESWPTSSGTKVDVNGNPILTSDGKTQTVNRPLSSANAQKQLNDLTKILQVMDTASFIERYSIYNWVEDARAILLNGEFTPAGAYYRDDASVMAYNPKKEVIPTWNYKSPVIGSSSLNTSRTIFTINLSTNPNGAMVSALLLEKKENNGTFQFADSITNVSTTKLELPITENENGRTSYRLRYFCKNGTYTSYSTETSYTFTNPEDNVLIDNFSFSNNSWNPIAFRNAMDTVPVLIIGPPTTANNNTFTTQRVNLLAKTGFNFRYFPWSYQSTTFKSDETSSYFGHLEGVFDWGGLTAVCKSVGSINGTWKTITFPQEFDTIPVVLASQVSSLNSAPVSIRIKNVTKTGFDVMIQKETSYTGTITTERISYMAVTPGEGIMNNHRIFVGTTKSIGSAAIYAQNVTWAGTDSKDYAFFATIQTTNNARGVELRLRSKDANQVKIFRQIENSDGGASSVTATEDAGWMVIYLDKTNTGINTVPAHKQNFTVYPNPAVDYIYFDNPDGSRIQGYIYNMLGQPVKSFVTESNCMGVQELANGYYMLKIGSNTCKFLKK